MHKNTSSNIIYKCTNANLIHEWCTNELMLTWCINELMLTNATSMTKTELMQFKKKSRNKTSPISVILIQII